MIKFPFTAWRRDHVMLSSCIRRCALLLYCSPRRWGDVLYPTRRRGRCTWCDLSYTWQVWSTSLLVIMFDTLIYHRLQLKQILLIDKQFLPYECDNNNTSSPTRRQLEASSFLIPNYIWPAPSTWRKCNPPYHRTAIWPRMHFQWRRPLSRFSCKRIVLPFWLVFKV